MVKEWEVFTLDEEFVEKNWSKFYDGVTLPGIDVSKNPIDVENPAGGKLDKNENIEYSYQQKNENGTAWGAATTGGKTPSASGLYEIEVRSTQYRADAKFSETYWGHNATGMATIRPVTSLTKVGEPTAPVRLSFTDAEGQEVTKEYTEPTWAQDDNAGNFNNATNNHLVVPVDVASDVLPFGESYPDGQTMSRTTCAAPTGTLQLYIDGRAVPASIGGVLEVGPEELADDDDANGAVVSDASGRPHLVAYFNLTRSQLERFGLESTQDNGHSVYVTYSSARSNAIARDEVATQAAQLGDGTQAGVDGVEPAYTDSSYVNYYESTAPASQVEIELAEPDLRLFNEMDTGYVPNGEGLADDQQAANDAKLLIDEKHERDYVVQEGGTEKRRGLRDGLTVVDFRDKTDDDGNVTEKRQDWFPLYVLTNSIGDIEFKSSNPSVISIEPNSFTDRAYVENKTDYGIGAKAKVVSAGKTTITATIKGTGAFTGASRSFDVYVFPDLAKEPVLSIKQHTYDTTRQDGTVRPGDILRTVVDVTNTTPDSACINPSITVSVPADTTFKRLVVVDADGNETDITEQVKDKIKDGKITVDTMPTLFGGQTYRVKMDVEVKTDVVDPTQPNRTPKLTSESTAKGIYGVDPDKFDWDNRIPSEGLPVTEVKASADPTGPAPKDPSDPGNKPGGGDEPGGDPDDPGNKPGGGDEPGGDPSDPGDNPGGGDEPGGNPDDPGNKPDNPDDPDDPKDPDDREDHDLVVVPTDPDLEQGDITVTKTWSNITPGAEKRANQEIVQVGDQLLYTITVANSKVGSAYYDATVADELPAGMEYVPGSIEIAPSRGNKLDKDDFEFDYHASSRKLYIAIGHVFGGEQVVVTFKVKITSERLDYNEPQKLPNVAHSFGTKPTDTVKDPDPVDPSDPDDPTPDGPKKIEIPDPTPGPYGDENPPTDPYDDEKGPQKPADITLEYTVKVKKVAEDAEKTQVSREELLGTLRELAAKDGYDLSAMPDTLNFKAKESQLKQADPQNGVLAGEVTGDEATALTQTGKSTLTTTFTKPSGGSITAKLHHIVWDEKEPETKPDVFGASAKVSEPVSEGTLSQAELFERALALAKSKTNLTIPAHMQRGDFTLMRQSPDGQWQAVGPEETIDLAKVSDYRFDANYSREASEDQSAMAGPLTLEYSIFKSTVPKSDETGGTSGPVAPSDPDPSKIKVSKDSQNLTPHEDGQVHVGDLLAYEITVVNEDAISTCIYDLVISDELPEGLEVVSGSLKLELPGGAEKEVSDAVYNPLTHSLSVYGGYLKGGETIKLRFQVQVAPEAEGKDIGNHATASYVNPSDSTTQTIFGTEPRPNPGEAAKASDFAHSRTTDPTPAAYPNGATGPVLPADGSAEGANTLKPAPALLRAIIPKTGDTATVAGWLGVLAAAALGATALMWRKRRHEA